MVANIYLVAKFLLGLTLYSMCLNTAMAWPHIEAPHWGLAVGLQNHMSQNLSGVDHKDAASAAQRHRNSEGDELQSYLEPPAQLPFRFNSAELENHWYGAVGRIADTLQEHPQLHLVLVGHTDLTGTIGYNRSLSERRAAYIAELLVKDFGIAKARIRVHGAGATDPLKKSTSPAVNATNRRVEVLFTQRKAIEKVAEGSNGK